MELARGVHRSRVPLAEFAYVLAAIACLTAWASPPLALALGVLLALTIENPFHSLTRSLSKQVLQASVVLLGFGMDLAVVARSGMRGLTFAAATIAAAFALGSLLGKRLHIATRVSTLISAGTAICGGSAIAAVGSVIAASEAEMTVALGTVFILNAVALYVFPPIGHALHMSGAEFGTWAGVAIHDVSSVVGAAARYGDGALPVAAAVKLSRALWIVPVSAVLGRIFTSHDPSTRSETNATTPKRRATPVPWFIIAFVVASILRSFVPTIQAAAEPVTRLAATGMTLSLFLIGTTLSMTTLRAVGVKPLLQGVQVWLLICVLSLVAIRWIV